MLLSSPDLMTLRVSLHAHKIKSLLTLVAMRGKQWVGVSVPPSFCGLSRDLVLSLEAVLWRSLPFAA